jgi:hypothetical protein
MLDLHKPLQAANTDHERGTRNVGLINIVRLAGALRVSPGKLLEPIPKKKPASD